RALELDVDREPHSPRIAARARAHHASRRLGVRRQDAVERKRMEERAHLALGAAANELVIRRENEPPGAAVDRATQSSIAAPRAQLGEDASPRDLIDQALELLRGAPVIRDGFDRRPGSSDALRAERVDIIALEATRE